MARNLRSPAKWSEIRGKNSLVRWAKVKQIAEAVGVEPRELAKRLIKNDSEHGFLLASDDNAVTKTPEHHCGPSNLEYEETLTLNAHTFTVSRFTAHNRKPEQSEHKTFSEAMQVAEGDARALIYATAASGRFVCLSRSNWEWLAVLWYVFKE